MLLHHLSQLQEIPNNVIPHLSSSIPITIYNYSWCLLTPLFCVLFFPAHNSCFIHHSNPTHFNHQPQLVPFVDPPGCLTIIYVLQIKTTNLFLFPIFTVIGVGSHVDLSVETHFHSHNNSLGPLHETDTRLHDSQFCELHGILNSAECRWHRKVPSSSSKVVGIKKVNQLKNDDKAYLRA